MPTVQIPENVAQITGPLIVGYLLNLGLFGILTVQVYYYYIAFPDDHRAFKILVYTVYMLEFVQSIVITFDAFVDFGIGYGNFEAVNTLPPTGLLVPILGGTVGFAVQLFYAYHIHSMVQVVVVSVIIIIIALIAWAFGIVTGILAFKLGIITELRTPSVFVIAGVWWGTTVVVNTIIGVSMCYVLIKKDPSFREKQSRITRGSRLLLETGVIITPVAIITLVFFFAWIYTDSFGCPALVFAKLYGNSMLALFNNRMRIIGSWDDISAQTADATQIDSRLSDVSSHVESLATRQRADSLLGGQTRAGTMTLGPGYRRPSEYLMSQRPRSGSGVGSDWELGELGIREGATNQTHDR